MSSDVKSLIVILKSITKRSSFVGFTAIMLNVYRDI